MGEDGNIVEFHIFAFSLGNYIEAIKDKQNGKSNFSYGASIPVFCSPCCHSYQPCKYFEGEAVAHLLAAVDNRQSFHPDSLTAVVLFASFPF